MSNDNIIQVTYQKIELNKDLKIDFIYRSAILNGTLKRQRETTRKSEKLTIIYFMSEKVFNSSPLREIQKDSLVFLTLNIMVTLFVHL